VNIFTNTCNTCHAQVCNESSSVVLLHVCRCVCSSVCFTLLVLSFVCSTKKICSCLNVSFSVVQRSLVVRCELLEFCVGLFVKIG